MQVFAGFGKGGKVGEGVEDEGHAVYDACCRGGGEC